MRPRISRSWDVTSKDFRVFSKKKSLIFSLLGFPLFISVLLSFVVKYIVQASGGSASGRTELLILLPSFTFYFAIIAAIIPTVIASYSIVGEKTEKSLEPLLATPMTDEEILLGKGIAAFIPPIAASYLGAIVFIIFTDVLTRGAFGYYYFPNLDAGVILLLLVPLSAIMSISVNVMISSRVSDVRVSQQLGSLAVIPMAIFYVAGELGLMSFSTPVMLAISGILVVTDIILILLARVTFSRDEILTKWK